jgi:hypothetical protein
MSRFHSLLFIFVCISAQAQISFTSWVNSYMQISSYSGETNPDAYTVTFAGNGNINLPYWKLSVRLKQSIQSNDGVYTIPANKISFQPISSTGQAYPNPIPSIAEIGASLNVMLQENSEVFLIPQSNAPMYNAPAKPKGYYNLQLNYAITVLGGSYLGNFPAWTKFTAPVEFTAYDQYNSVIGKVSHQFQFQIGNITGTPPADVMTLKINMDASNGVLEFKSMQDYINGTSVTYSNGLMVTSTGNFQIKVRSLQNNLISSSGSSIPVEVIHLLLSPLDHPNQTVHPITLNMSSQTLAQAISSQNTSYNYDIKYFTSPQDERLINAKPEDYATTLQYEIMPQ